MPDLRLQEIFEQGQDSGRGNLLGVQPFMHTSDYAGESAFYAKLSGYFQAAAEKGWLSPRTVVALPEYIGSWLVAAGEPQSVYSARSIQAAMRPLVLRHSARVIAAMLRAKSRDRATASLFQVKADSMAGIYQAVFSRLAMQYGVTIVAGSILLPDPIVVNGRVTAGKGPLYNTSFVFHPDGQADRMASRKAFPIDTELPFVAPARVEDIPVWETPAGRLGVLVCADSWFPEAYRQLKAQGVDLLVVPSAANHRECWEAPWGGYSGWPEPPDVDPRDIGRLTERQAWEKYAMTGRMAASGAAAGMNIFLYGELWDLAFDSGQWRLVQGDTFIEGSCQGAALINLWL